MNALFFLCLSLFTFIISATTNDDAFAECTPSANPPNTAFILNGGFVFIFIGIVYSLWGLAMICEDYFVPALEVFCMRWKVPYSVAGSLVMAGGTDAPGFVVCLFGTLIQKSAIGIGTIIGSELFNHLIVTTIVCLSAKENNVKLSPLPFFRECLGYAVSLLLLLWACGANVENIFNRDKWNACLSIKLAGSIVLVLGQFAYTLFVSYYDNICLFFGLLPPVVEEHVVERKIESEVEVHDGNKVNDSNNVVMSRESSFSVELGESLEQSLERKQEFFHLQIEREPSLLSIGGSEKVPEVEKNESFGQLLLSRLVTLFNITTYPLFLLVEHTTPDCRCEENRHRYGLTLLSSIIWICLFLFCLTECLTFLGILFNISPLIMGMVVSGPGTSIPTMWASYVVSDNGDMAISNALGSNTFNVFICLGFPWLLYNIIFGDYNMLQDGGIVWLTLTLVALILLYFFMIMSNDWRLSRWMAFPLVTLYIAVIVIFILLS